MHIAHAIRRPAILGLIAIVTHQEDMVFRNPERTSIIQRVIVTALINDVIDPVGKDLVVLGNLLHFTAAISYNQEFGEAYMSLGLCYYLTEEYGWRSMISLLI